MNSASMKTVCPFCHKLCCNHCHECGCNFGAGEDHKKGCKSDPNVYIAPTHNDERYLGSHRVPVLTPDGGVIMASSLADANRIADELNLMQKKLQEKDQELFNLRHSGGVQ